MFGKKIILLGLIFFTSVCLPQTFEGKIVAKEISLNINSVRSALMEETEANYDESWDNLSDEELFQMQVEKLFYRNNEELKNLAMNSEDPGYEEETYSEYLSEIWVKGSKMSIWGEDQDGKYAVIFDLHSPAAYILKPDEKIVIEFDLNKFSQQTKQMMGDHTSTNEDNFSMTSTGKTKKINGYGCTLYKGTNEDGDPQQLWVTTSIDAGLLAVFVNLMEYTSKLARILINEKETNFYKSIGGIPIVDKHISYDNLNISEILSVEQITVPDSKFTVPSDYKKMSWEQMMNQE